MTSSSEPCSLAELKNLKQTVAAIIVRDGPALVPVFVRLEEMEAEFALHQDVLERARRLATDKQV